MRQLNELGKKTAVLPLPEITSIGSINTRHVLFDDAPRSGQAWKIDSIYYSFAEAHHHNNAKSKLGEENEILFRIVLMMDGVELGKQEIVIKEPAGRILENANEVIRGLIGTIEPIRPQFLFNSLELVITISTKVAFVESEKGTAFVNYTLYA